MVDPEEPKKQTRICFSNAKLVYGLTDGDLKDLTYETARNPHYRYAAPMRLYDIEEVEAVAKAKQERRRYEEEHAEDIAEEKAAAARERRAAASEAARAAVKGFQECSKQARHGSVPLNDEVLAKIMTCLVNFLEPEGVWGPSLVARDLAAVALAVCCWDCYHAAKVAFLALRDVVATPLQPDLSNTNVPHPDFLPMATSAHRSSKRAKSSGGFKGHAVELHVLQQTLQVIRPEAA
eukprot:gene12518-12652_t